MDRDTIQQIAQAASEAASAPAVKLGVAGTLGASLGELLSSGTGLLALGSFVLTLVTAAVTIWAKVRQDLRDQRLADARLRQIEAGDGD